MDRSPALRGVFFDLDGTVADTVAAITAALNELFTRHGMPLLREEDTIRCINYGARELVRRAAPDTCTPEQLDLLFEEYLGCYKRHNLDTRHPYEEMNELIYLLKRRGYICAVVTNKPNELACELVRSLFGSRFDLTLGQSPELTPKPNAAMANYALERLGLRPSEVIFIGDSTVDVAFARNSGMRFIGAGWGFFGHEALHAAGAAEIACRPLEILNFL